MASGNGELTADLVVLGGGGAGLAAAIAAAESGCQNVIVLEKAASAAGSTVMAHDIFAAESPVQARWGVDAPKDALFKTAMEWAHWTHINPRLVRAFIDKSGDTIRWLEEKGLNFELIQFYPNQVPLVRHSVEGHGARLMKVLRESAEGLGVKIMTRSAGKQLVRGEDGKVTKVVAATSDGDITIATKGVVVATGGYGNNKEMLRKYCKYYYDSFSYDGPPSNTGDGITMATAIGADTAGLGCMNLHGPRVSMKSSSDLMNIDTVSYHGGPLRIGLWLLDWEPQTIWVNKHGKRFVNEGYNQAFFAFGNTVAMQPDGLAYTILDSRTVGIIEEQGFIRAGAARQAVWLPVEGGVPLPGLQRELQKIAGNGDLSIADSLDDVAAWIGADPATLRATIDEYNGFCDEKHDGLFAKDPRFLWPIRVAPYYVIKGHVAICDAYGGIKIDEKMQALDTQDQPIPGLYAAGSTAGQVETDSYCYPLTGHLVGWALNSGRIAGESAAAYVAGS